MNPLQQRASWADIHKRNIRDHLILLDIDGVLMADGETTIAPEMREHVTRLAKHNDVRILTNTFFKKRAQYARDTLHIPWIDSPHKKPSTKILKYIVQKTPRPVVMIGDKFLTDGLFALRIGATPILLERRVHVDDSFLIRIVNAIDDFTYWAWKLFRRLRN